MAVANFPIASVFEQEINRTIELLGFSSKSEFYRFAIRDFIERSKENRNKAFLQKDIEQKNKWIETLPITYLDQDETNQLIKSQNSSKYKMHSIDEFIESL